MNKEEVKIQFTATATGLDEIYKKINEIKKAPNIKLDEKLLGQLKDLETKVPALIDKIKNTLANQDFSIIDVQVLDNEFKQLVKVFESTITNLGKANLPAAISDQIEQARNEVKKAQNELAEVNRAIKGKQKKLDSNSASGLNASETTKVAKAQGASFELGDKTFGLNFEEYVKAYKSLEKQGKVTAAMQEDFKINTELLAPEFEKVKKAIQNEIDALKAKVPAIQQAIQQGQQYEQSLKEQAASNENLSAEEKKVAQAIIDASNSITKAKANERNAISAATEKVEKDTQVKEQNTTAQDKNTSSIAKAAKQVFTYGTVLNAFRKIYSTVTSTISEMDKALTSMAVVTNMTKEQARGLIGEFESLAMETGKTSTEIADMTTKFLQQGKSISQAIKLTEAAAKAATIAGIDGSRSIDLLTNAMNGFQISANKAMEVSDKFAALAASAATDYEELATALSKVAAQANLAGMSMDFTLGLLTKGIEVTREAPETIGTALKTVIARMRELTDYGATLEDGIDVNRVAKALDNIGVSLMDANGQFRDLELVLTEVGQKWDTLNKNQQANVAVALAGTRQQSRLIAMMQDFDRTLELVDISANSYGATLAQSEKYMGGLEAAQNKLTTSTQSLINELVNSEVIIGFTDFLTKLVQTADVLLNEWHLTVPILTVLGLMLTNMLATKMAEINLKRQDRLEEEKAKLDDMKHWSAEEMQAKKKEVASKKDQKNQKKTALNDAKKLLKEKQITLEDTKQSILNNKTLSEEEKQYKIKLAEMDARDEIADAEAEVVKAQQEYNTANQEYLTANAELTNMRSQQLEYSAKALQVQVLQNSQAGILGGLFNAILIPLQAIQTVMTIINAVQTVFNMLKNKEIGLHNKNAAAVTKEGAAKQISAGWGMAGSASAIPVVGWVIAGAIIAAVIGMMIAAAVQSGKTGDETSDSIAKTREELNQLQADLYNLDTARKNVSKLGDEFDSLSNKVVKTSEDIERMEEIIQNINDQAGYEVINTMADAATQRVQMKAYEMSLEEQKQNKINDINKTLTEGYKDAAYNTVVKPVVGVGSRTVQWTTEDVFDQAGHDAYMKALQSDQSFVNSVRTVGLQSIEGLDGVSSNTSSAILDMLVQNIGDVFNEENGVDAAKFQELLGGEQGWNNFVSQLDKTMQEGSFGAYVDMYDQIKQAADNGSEAAQKQLKALSEAIPMFGAINSLGVKAAKTFEQIGFSGDEMNTIMSTLTKNAKLTGKAVGDDLASLVEGIDGEDATEKRREAYVALVEAQKEAQIESAKVLNMDAEQLKQAAANNNAYASHYIELKQKETDAAIKKAEAERKIEEEKKKSSGGDTAVIEEQNKIIEEAEYEIAEATLGLEEFSAAAQDTNPTIEELKTLLGTVGVSEITDELTKMSSAMERVAKVTDLANLSIKEQIDLLSDYPELLSAMEKGFLTAEEAYNLWEEQANKTLTDITTAKGNYQTIYSTGTGDISSSSSWGSWSNLFDEDKGGQLRQDLVNKGKLSTEDEFVQMLYNTKIQELIQSGLTEDEAKAQYSISDALTAATNIQADVQEYNKYSAMQTRYNQEGITAFMDEETKEAWANAQNVIAANRAKIDSYTDELEILEEGTAEYEEVYKKRQQALVQSLTDSEKETKDIQDRIDQILGKGTENDLSAYVDFVDGVAYLNKETTENLSQEEKDKLAIVIQSLNAQGEAYEESMERRKEDQELLAQSIIDSEAKILEAQIENLEKRQQAYEEYFDAIDKLNEEEERTATMQDISKQLSALSGGSDAVTSSLRKELLSQMEDLRKEEEDARKEAAREALISDIESQTEELNTQLDTVNDSLNKIIAIIALANQKDSNVTMEVTDNGEIKFKRNGQDWTPFAAGGLVDYTGPAMVHGSPNAPEAFLSAQDTKNMQLLFAALNDVVAKSTAVNVSGEGGGANNISIDSINIHTNELNNDQDFRSAGQIFAEEFGKAIRQRGLNINVRK